MKTISLQGIALIICLLTMMNCTVFAKNAVRNKMLITEVVEGYGQTDQEALKNAFHEAIRKALGFYLIAKKTTIDDCAKTEIYSNADGLVVEHKVLERSVVDGGTIRLKIEAKIMQQKFVESLEKKTTSIIDETSIVDIQRKNESRIETKKALEAIFENFPYNMLDMQLLGKLKLSEDAEIGKGDFVDVSYKVIVSVKYDEYSRFIQKLKGILRMTAIKYEELNVLDSRSINFAHDGKYIIYMKEYIDNNKIYEDPLAMKYSKFFLPKNLYDIIDEKQFANKNGAMVVEFLDESSEVIYRDFSFFSYISLFTTKANAYVDFYDERINFKIRRKSLNYSYSGDIICFAPVLNCYGRKDFYLNALEFSVKSRIPLDILKRIKSCKMKIISHEQACEILYSKKQAIKNQKTGVKVDGCYLHNRPFLGIQMNAANYSRGVTVSKVFPGTAAEKAGINKGDMIVSVNGIYINEGGNKLEKEVLNTFVEMTYRYCYPGEPAIFRIFRGERELLKIAIMDGKN